jgi:SAM-dependent methyltransferase
MPRISKRPPQRGQFDNAEFWEERYRQNLALGSGGGSRGQYLLFKRRLLEDLLLQYQPRTLLDVGCGDIEVTRTLTFSGTYTGIDLSPFIVARNQELRADWQFLHGDFLELQRCHEVHADLVLCLDVLIHQHDHAVYREFVRQLVGAAEAALLVNGFEVPPRSGRLSPNVAFHEPITQTLRECGVENMHILGEFRNTVMVIADCERAELPASSP